MHLKSSSEIACPVGSKFASFPLFLEAKVGERAFWLRPVFVLVVTLPAGRVRKEFLDGLEDSIPGETLAAGGEFGRAAAVEAIKGCAEEAADCPHDS
jgi:hypothetical protein